MKFDKTYRSNGKLLLTGEYVVLDGAKALAVPTKFGQSLSVKEYDSNTIVWKSYDENEEVWFQEEFSFKSTSTALSVTASSSSEISDRLVQILKATHQLNPEFLSFDKGYTIETHQDFNRKWGLGTSSTLINNIANWANIDAYKLLDLTFGGSGYDIACAQHNTPVTYQLLDSETRIVEPATFRPSFKDKLYLVYLNQKQNSRDGIKAYKSLNKVDTTIIENINEITDAMIRCESFQEFKILIDQHETIISNLIAQEPIKARLFKDFTGSIKSLGAWGGDFVLVASENNPTDYFKSKGFKTIIPYTNMVLK